MELGERHGFRTQPTYSAAYPTDGVWFLPSSHGELATVPVAAIEVVSSEGPKSILGSIAVLEAVSPGVGIVLLHEEELARRLIRDGADREHVRSFLTSAADRIDRHIAVSRQRLKRWSFSELRWLHARAFHQVAARARGP